MTVIAERSATDAPLEAFINDSGGATGLTVVVAVRDAQTSDSWLDFADSTFKTSGWTTRQATLAEVNAGNAPGHYRVVGGLDIAAITNLPAGTDDLVLEYDITAGGISGGLTEQLQLVESVLDLPADVDSVLTAAHGAGAWTTGAGASTNTAFASVAYVNATDTLAFQCWLERNGVATVPTAVTVQVVDESGAIVLTVTDAAPTPDANNVVFLSGVLILLQDVSYYLLTTITDATGSVVTRSGIPTVD